MRHFLFGLTAAALLASPALAQTTTGAPAGAYVVDKPHTSIQWQGLHNGLSWYTARFTGFDIQLTFDPADVTKSKVTATIDPKSIETDFLKTRPAGSTTDFNAELATGDRWFNGNKFPTITFASTSITKSTATTGKMTGNLTFLGVTKPVTLDVTFVGTKSFPAPKKAKVGFRVSGTINKSQWGMAGGPVADDIKIEINAEFDQK